MNEVSHLINADQYVCLFKLHLWLHAYVKNNAYKE